MSAGARESQCYAHVTTAFAHPYGAAHRHLRATTPGYGAPCTGYPVGYHDGQPGPAPAAVELNHVIAVAQGGVHGPVNWLCLRCNRAKGVIEDRTVRRGGRSWRDR